MSDELEAPPPDLREATEAEHDLVDRLHLAASLRLLAEWEQIPPEQRVLSHNRALLSALARSLGTFLGAITAANPTNEEGWQELMRQTLEMAKQTAIRKRAQVLESLEEAGNFPTRGVNDPPVFVFPESKTVM